MNDALSKSDKGKDNMSTFTNILYRNTGSENRKATAMDNSQFLSKITSNGNNNSNRYKEIKSQNNSHVYRNHPALSRSEG